MGVGELRPSLNDDEVGLVERLWKWHVRDVTVLCSPELSAYLGVFPRELSASK